MWFGIGLDRVDEVILDLKTSSRTLRPDPVQDALSASETRFLSQIVENVQSYFSSDIHGRPADSGLVESSDSYESVIAISL